MSSRAYFPTLTCTHMHTPPPPSHVNTCTHHPHPHMYTHAHTTPPPHIHTRTHHSQLEMKLPTLSYTVFQKTLVHMLTRSWGSLHTYQDHQDTSNMCLLCQAMALWFSLVNKLIKEYARREESSGGDEAADLGSPTVSRRKFSLKQLKSLTPMHRRKKAVSMAEGSVAAVSQHHKLSHGTKLSEESVEMYDFDSSRRQSADTVQEFPFEEVRSKNDRPRKMATVQSHSEFEVVSRRGVSSFAPPPLPPAYEEEMQEDAIPPIYKIFRLCMQVGDRTFKHSQM